MTSSFLLRVAFCALLFPCYVFSIDLDEYFSSRDIPNKQLSSSIFLTIGSKEMDIDTLFGKWETKPNISPQNGFLGIVYVDIGAGLKDNISIGYFEKMEFILSADSDFAEAFYALKNSSTLPIQNRAYDMDAVASGYRSRGIFVQKDFLFDKTKTYIRSNLHIGNRVQELKIDGYYGEFANKRKFNSNVHYYFGDKNYLTHQLNQQIDSAKGIGGSFDLGAEHDFEYMSLKGGINNLGFIKWSNIYSYNANADSNNTYIGSDGYLHYKSIISGRYTRENSRLIHLPTYIYTGITSNSNLPLKTGLLYYQNEYFGSYYPSVEYKINSKNSLKIAYDTFSNRYDLSYKHRNWDITLGADKISSHPRGLSFGVSVRY